jgi:hypothetical protein
MTINTKLGQYRRSTFVLLTTSWMRRLVTSHVDQRSSAIISGFFP